MGNVSVPNEAIISGPEVNWTHIDGPLMSWASMIHWLTWSERVRLTFGLTTIDKLACERWPHTAMIRAELMSKQKTR